MKKLNYIYYFIIILFISCSGEDSGSGDGGGDPPPPPPAPAASTLSTPAKDTECLDGENVEFKWSASNNTDSYDIFVKNLLLMLLSVKQHLKILSLLLLKKEILIHGILSLSQIHQLRLLLAMYGSST